MLVDVEIGLSPNCSRDVWECEFDQEMRDHFTPRRIQRGLYLCNEWNPEIMLRINDSYKVNGFPDEAPVYGVCDTPEQVVMRYGLDELPGKFVVTFVRIRKDEEPQRDGWRWHKWGPYIGTQHPRCEYIADEPDIQEVFTFHIHNPAYSTPEMLNGVNL